MANVLGMIQQPMTHEWETPQGFFNALNDEFDFTLDVAADETNHKIDRYFGCGGLEMSGLSANWGTEVVWCNPPYGTQIGKWVARAYEASREGATVVMLIPARTDTSWWHRYVMRSAEIRLVAGRLRFSGALVNAPFPSAVIVFRPGWFGSPALSAISREAALRGIRVHTYDGE